MNETTPTFERLLDEWQQLAKELKELSAKEAELRRSLFAAAFPQPKEGVNKRVLVDGRIFKGTHKINRSVDEAAVQGAIQEIRQFGRNDILPEDIFPVKHSLGIAAYKKSPDNIRKIADRAITARPGTPTITVE